MKPLSIAILHFTLYTLHALALPVESTDARLVWSLDGPASRLPDVVTTNAYYDTASPSGKVLRVSGEVASAVLSLWSGLVERAYMGEGRGGGSRSDDIYLPFSPTNIWPGAEWIAYTNWVYLADSFRTNWYSRELHDLWPPESQWIFDPTNREVRTLRILPPRLVDSVWPILRHLAEPASGASPQFGVMGRWWGSSMFGGGASASCDFPAFDWTTNDVSTVLTDSQWASVWPEYASAARDDRWKLTDSAWHGSVFAAIDWFPKSDWDGRPYGFRDPAIAASAAGPSPAGIVDAALSTNGTRAIASTTQRLSYFKLGAAEVAVHSMDTTYDVGTGLDSPPYRVADYDHRHYRDLYLPYSTRSIQVNWRDMSLDIGQLPANGWIDRDDWSTITNATRFMSANHPAVYCSGDIPYVDGTADAESYFAIDYDWLYTVWCEHAAHCADAELATLAITCTPGRVSYDPPYITYTTASAHTTWDYNLILPDEYNWYWGAAVRVERATRVAYTTPAFEPPADASSVMPWYPSGMAWRRGLVDSVRLNSLESRQYVTNCVINWDSAEYSATDGTQVLHDWRSVYCGEARSRSALEGLAASARLGLRNAWLDILPANPGDREALLPIPLAELDRLRAAIPTTLNLSIGPSDAKPFTFTMTADGDFLIPSRYGLDTEYVGPGDWFLAGWLFADAHITTNSTNIATLPSFYAGTDQTAAQRIRWRFSNLRTPPSNTP